MRSGASVPLADGPTDQGRRTGEGVVMPIYGRNPRICAFDPPPWLMNSTMII